MRLTKGQLKRIIREEYTKLQRQGLIKESVGSYGGDPIDTICMFVEELHDQGDSAFTAWSKIAQLDRKANANLERKISRHFTVTPVAAVISPEQDPALWQLWDRGQFLEYRDAIKRRLSQYAGEQWLQALADEISAELERMSLRQQVLEMIDYLENGDDLGMILDFSDLKEFVSNGDKEGALEEIGYMYEGTETAGHDELLQELERLIGQM